MAALQPKTPVIAAKPSLRFCVCYALPMPRKETMHCTALHCAGPLFKAALLRIVFAFYQRLPALFCAGLLSKAAAGAHLLDDAAPLCCVWWLILHDIAADKRLELLQQLPHLLQA